MFDIGVAYGTPELYGMVGRLRDVDALLIEASSIATLRNGPEFHDVVLFLKEHGFVIYDMLRTLRRPLDGALAQLDVLFVPEDSFLRADRRWAASA